MITQGMSENQLPYSPERLIPWRMKSIIPFRIKITENAGPEHLQWVESENGMVRYPANSMCH